MITYLTGVPRSGKTYFAVNYIYDKFVNGKLLDNKGLDKQYLYTNIGGFKFDDINEQLLKNPIEDELGNLTPKLCVHFDTDKVLYHIKHCYDLAHKGASDDELIEYLISKRLYRTLFVIDESYMVFKKVSEPIKVWWLAYHGHLGMEIIIIIHNLNLIHSDYKAFSETFVRAMPKVFSLSNNQLRYTYYSDETFKEGYDNKSLPAKQYIFDLYKSGDLHKPKKPLYKYLGFIILAILFVFYNFYSFFENHTSDNPQSQLNNPQPLPPHNQNLQSTGYLDMSTEILFLTCDYEKCRLTDQTGFKEATLPFNYIKKVFKENNIEIYYTQSTSYLQNITTPQRYSFMNYVYEIPKNIKKKYLAALYIQEKKNLNRSVVKNNQYIPFSTIHTETEKTQNQSHQAEGA